MDGVSDARELTVLEVVRVVRRVGPGSQYRDLLFSPIGVYVAFIEAALKLILSRRNVGGIFQVSKKFRMFLAKQLAKNDDERQSYRVDMAEQSRLLDRFGPN